MRTTVSRIAALAAAGATGLALTMVGATASATQGDDHTTTGGFRPAAVDWQPCKEKPDDATVRCGTLQVPVDWAHPDGPTFGVAIAKQAASDPADDKGPLVINPGGPGGSGVDFALDAASFFSPEVLKHFDIIGFDPRGTNRSNPVECSTDLLDKQPFAVPGNQADYSALLAYNAKLGADCRAHTGPVYDHIDTVSVDRDIDAIRAALGQDKISYYGVSYGTLIGQEYAELFPDRIRAMVIDSNMDHSLGTLPFLLTEASTDEDSFGQFIAWCDRDTTCALHGKDVGALWDKLMSEADAGKLTDPATGQKLTWWELTQGAIGMLYGPDWAPLGETIAGLDSGKPAAAAALEHAAKPRPVKSNASTGLSEDPIMVFCEDWSLPVSSYQQSSAYFAATKAVARHLRTSTLGWGVAYSCLGSPTPVNAPQHRLQVHADVPLLVLNSVHDPATPYAWAVDDAVQLGKHARFVTYLGWGHGAYPHSDCTTGTVDDYLINGTLPQRGATCAAVPPPDQSGQAGQSAMTHLPVPNIGF